MKNLETKEARVTGLRMNLCAFITLLFLVLITYSNSFHASWHLDDGPNITENRRSRLQKFSWSEIRDSLVATPSGSSVDFPRPVARFSFAVNYHFFGRDVFAYHVVNVSIHVVASFFLYLFLSCALRLPAFRARLGAASDFAALLATLFWAIHPIQTQAVTYIVQRMASMAGMFYVMSMYFALKAQIEPNRMARRLFFAASVASGILSFGSKENAILLPASIFLFRLLIVQGFTRENLLRNLKEFSLGYLLPLLVVTGLLWAFQDFIGRVFALYGARSFTLWERILTEQRVLLFYISLLLYPLSTRFSIDHPIEISRSFLDPPSTLISILALLILLGAALLIARRQPLITFSILFFFLNHVVESTVLPMELVFEHRNYIPSMFFFLPVAIGILKLHSSFSRRRPMRLFLLGSVALLVTVLGHSTFMRNRAWKDERSLWTDCLQKYPESFRAHHNLGKEHSLSGDAKRASQEYALALGSPLTSPKDKGITYFNLGLLAHDRGDTEAAYGLYKKAIEIDPCCPGVNNNLAGILMGRSLANAPEALRLLDQAINCRQDAETALAWSNKSILLWRLGRAEEALKAARKGFEMDPDSPLNLLRLGYIQKESGDLEMASLHFRRLLEMDHRNIRAFLFLAEIQFCSGQIGEGKKTLKRMLAAVSVDELTRFIEIHRAEGAGLEVLPRMELLLPFLEEFFQEKGISFPKTAGRETGQGTQ